MELDINTVYTFKGEQVELKDIIPIIEPGDGIVGVNSFIIANKIIKLITQSKNNNLSYTYLFDGPDKIILFAKNSS